MDSKSQASMVWYVRLAGTEQYLTLDNNKPVLSPVPRNLVLQASDESAPIDKQQCTLWVYNDDREAHAEDTHLHLTVQVLKAHTLSFHNAEGAALTSVDNAALDWRHDAQAAAAFELIPAANKAKTKAPAFAVKQDVKLTTQQKLALARKFAPQVMMHRSEKFNPQDVNVWLPNVSLEQGRTTWPEKTLIPKGQVTSQRLGEYYRYDHKEADWWWLDDGGNGNWRLGTGVNNNPPVYAHFYQSGDQNIDIQYFFFYPYNASPWDRCLPLVPLDDVVGNHVCDWEHATVRLVDNNGSYELAGVFYAGHDKDPKWSSTPELTADGHPIVYCAWGSHASYPHVGKSEMSDWPCDWNISEGQGVHHRGALGDDICDSRGPQWHTWNNVQLIDWDSADNHWVRYGGRWGQTDGWITKSPFGPGAKDVYWKGDPGGVLGYEVPGYQSYVPPNVWAMPSANVAALFFNDKASGNIVMAVTDSSFNLNDANARFDHLSTWQLGDVINQMSTSACFVNDRDNPDQKNLVLQVFTIYKSGESVPVFYDLSVPIVMDGAKHTLKLGEPGYWVGAYAAGSYNAIGAPGTTEFANHIILAYSDNDGMVRLAVNKGLEGTIDGAISYVDIDNPDFDSAVKKYQVSGSSPGVSACTFVNTSESTGQQRSYLVLAWRRHSKHTMITALVPLPSPDELKSTSLATWLNSQSDIWTNSGASNFTKPPKVAVMGQQLYALARGEHTRDLHFWVWDNENWGWGNRSKELLYKNNVAQPGVASRIGGPLYGATLRDKNGGMATPLLNLAGPPPQD